MKLNKDPVFYNYIIFDAKKLYSLLDNVTTPLLHFSSKVLNRFKLSCVYVGKGSSIRKNMHICYARKIDKCYAFQKRSNNSKNILELWKRNMGICILQLPVETNHFEAHCKEYALIKAINLKHLNNQINGTAYGCMKMWNNTEVRNFGNMLLYYAMNICINERPAIIKH